MDAGEAPYSLVAARSLSSKGHSVDLGFSIGSRIFAAYSKHCRHYLFYPDPSYAPDDFINFANTLIGKYDFIIPTMEKTQLVLSKIKDYLEKMGTTIPISSHDVLSVATNKAKMLEIAREKDVSIPKTLVLTQEPELKELVNSLGIPFIMKTSKEADISPGPGSRYFVIKSHISQESFQSKFRQLLEHGPVILQQYVNGAGIGASFAFARNNKVIAYFGHQRILERFSEGGPSVIAETNYHQAAITQGFQLLSALEWQGVAMTEFKLGSDGQLYFMEVNPRFWGTLPLAIASGVDFPNLLVDCYNTSQCSQSHKILAKKKTLVSCLVLPQLLESLEERNLDFARENLRSTLRIFDHGLPFIVEFEKHDFSPFIRQVLNKIRAILNKNKISRIGPVFFGPHIPYNKLAELNIQSVIDLREEAEKTDHNQKINRTIEYYEFPIKDDTAPELATFLALISMISDIAEKESVYIHCRLGRGRAPMVVIAYLISKGVPINDAYSIVYDARPYAFLNLMQKQAIYAIYKNYLEQRNKNHLDSSTQK